MSAQSRTYGPLAGGHGRGAGWANRQVRLIRVFFWLGRADNMVNIMIWATDYSVSTERVWTESRHYGDSEVSRTPFRGRSHGLGSLDKQ